MFNTNYQVGGRFDYPFYPTKNKPYIKGVRVPVPKGVTKHRYLVPDDMELLTVSIGCSRYSDLDYWSLWVDGVLVFDSIYTKDVPEGFYFMVVREVKTGSHIDFEFTNASGQSKIAWLNYQFLKD